MSEEQGIWLAIAGMWASGFLFGLSFGGAWERAKAECFARTGKFLWMRKEPKMNDGIGGA